MAQVRRVTPSLARTDRRPPPGLVIFTPRHYSLAWARAPLPAVRRPWSPTAEEELDCLSSLAFDTGAWELEGSRLVTRPTLASTLALNGGRASWRWRVHADTLWLTQDEAVSAAGDEDPSSVLAQTSLMLLRAE